MTVADAPICCCQVATLPYRTQYREEQRLPHVSRDALGRVVEVGRVSWLLVACTWVWGRRLNPPGSRGSPRKIRSANVASWKITRWSGLPPPRPRQSDGPGVVVELERQPGPGSGTGSCRGRGGNSLACVPTGVYRPGRGRSVAAARWA